MAVSSAQAGTRSVPAVPSIGSPSSQAPWLGLFPGLAITITILGLNTPSDSLRTALGPRAV